MLLSLTCQVCGRSGECSPLYSRQMTQGQPFFPFLSSLPLAQVSAKRQPVSSDVRFGCKMCVSFLLNQWADFERREVPLAERSYYVKKKSLLTLGAPSKSAVGQRSAALSVQVSGDVPTTDSSTPPPRPLERTGATSDMRSHYCAACKSGLNGLNRTTLHTAQFDAQLVARLCSKSVSELEPTMDLCIACYTNILSASSALRVAERRQTIFNTSTSNSSRLATILLDSVPSHMRPGESLLPNFTRLFSRAADSSEPRHDPNEPHHPSDTRQCSPDSQLTSGVEAQKESTDVQSGDVRARLLIVGGDGTRSPTGAAMLSECRGESFQQHRGEDHSLCSSSSDLALPEEQQAGGADARNGFVSQLADRQLPLKKQWRNYNQPSDHSEDENCRTTVAVVTSARSSTAERVTSPCVLTSSDARGAEVISATGSRAGSRAPSPEHARSNLVAVAQVTESGVFNKQCRPVPLTRPGSPPAGSAPVLVVTEPSSTECVANDEATTDAPFVCYVCGAFEFKPYSLYVKPCTQDVIEINGLRSPFFPCLSELKTKGAQPVCEDGSTSVCQICYSVLMAQWNEFEISSNAKNVDRFSRRYDASRLPCYVCGTVFRRRRAAVLRVSEFPSLRYHSRPTGAVALRRGRECVVCRSCASALGAQLQEYKKMGLPPHLRQYNWNSRKERQILSGSSESDEASDGTDLTERDSGLAATQEPTLVGIPRMRRRKRQRINDKDVSDDEAATPSPRKRNKRSTTRSQTVTCKAAGDKETSGFEDVSCGCPSDSQRDDTDVTSISVSSMKQPRTPRRRKPRQHQRPWLGPNPLSWGSVGRATQSEEDPATHGLTCLATAAAQVNSTPSPSRCRANETSPTPVLLPSTSRPSLVVAASPHSTVESHDASNID